jgi:hypothetical protein
MFMKKKVFLLLLTLFACQLTFAQTPAEAPVVDPNIA